MQNLSSIQEKILRCPSQVAKKMCKTVLSVYNLLPYVTSALDNLIMKKAESSMYLAVGQTVENCAGEILSLTDQKVSLINLKVLIDESLSELKEKDARILLLRFVDNVKCEDCLEILNMDKRTFFRRLAVALQSFYKVFNFKLLHQKLAKQGILGQIDDAFVKVEKFVDHGGDIGKNRECICGLILNNLRRVCK